MIYNDPLLCASVSPLKGDLRPAMNALDNGHVPHTVAVTDEIFSFYLVTAGKTIVR